MKSPLAPATGLNDPKYPGRVSGYTSTLLCILLLLASAPNVRSQTAPLTLTEASDCCNLSSQAIDPLGPDGPWWNEQDYTRAAHITPDQQQRLNVLYSTRTETIRDLQRRYLNEKDALKSLLAAASPDEAAIDSQIARIEQARSAAAKTILQTKLAVRQQLSDDQWKQVQKLQQKKSKSQS